MGVNVSVTDCLSPVTNWRINQGVTLLLPNETCDRLQPLCLGTNWY